MTFGRAVIPTLLTISKSLPGFAEVWEVFNRLESEVEGCEGDLVALDVCWTGLFRLRVDQEEVGILSSGEPLEDGMDLLLPEAEHQEEV